MIQRIQTLYLAIVFILGILFLLLPIIRIGSNGEYIEYNGMDMPYVLILEAITLVFVILTIFKYKNQKLQIRLSAFSIILQIGMPFLVWASIYKYPWDVKTSFGIPIIQAILTWLAIRGIFKDYITIKSMDRLR